MAQIIRRTKTGGYYTVTATHIRPWPGATRTLMEGLAKLSGEPLKVTDIAEEHWAAFTGNLQDTRTGKKFEP